ncbi:MAG: S8 family serine peptidase, partial [Verrucomicrobiae bacterium]|nr:S8 family serine peptidase [Verrucomicrobiae bacterium]
MQLRAEGWVLAAEPVLAKQQRKKFYPNDPYFSDQWHLLNGGQGGGAAGVDINVTNVWDRYRGSNVVIGIVDDGLQWSHPDLTGNCELALSWDFNGADPDPSPNVKTDPHGTCCAGVAAGCGGNGIGVSGAAMGARLAGLRLVAEPTTDVEEAAALSFSNAAIFVKSNSWGPEDDGRTLEGPGPLLQAAFSNAVASGRGGKGVIITWAGGNGLAVNDNANYDGYANSMYTIAVGAVSDQGLQASYSEPGACLVVVAPSSSAGRPGISTTDLVGKNGYNSSGPTDYPNRDYTKTFGGTSAATPLVAGVCALLLEANPELGWRDVQEILMRSATQTDPADPDWCTNAAGFHFNHKYGAGLVNAEAAVALATNWVNLGPRQHISMIQSNLALAIPDNDTNGVTVVFDCAGCRLRIEQVVVTVHITHSYRGDLAMTLTSAAGTRSRLTERHADPADHYVGWPLMSVRHWGESAAGAWSVRIADVAAAD